MTLMATATAPTSDLESADDSAGGTVTGTHADQAGPRDTRVITVVVGAALALAAVVIVVLMWMYVFGVFGDQPGIGGSEGPGARPWHYWVSLFIASGIPPVLAAIGFGYYWQLVRPRLRAR